MRDLRAYAVVTGSYWVFTLTDGALRMLVLLHLYALGHTPLEIALLFLFYEFFGVVTNLVGGWLGARFGLRSTLFAGLTLQVIACSMLAVNPALLTLAYVMAAQALSGVAKDLTKMSSKSFIKLVIPDEDQGGLMKWVSILTGSKNTLKGAGFFFGGLLLATLGFRMACLVMAAALVVALLVATALLPRAAGKATGKAKFSSVFSKDPRVNWLSAARFFLFGSRDIWFVLALPIFFASNLHWSSEQVGGFLALWVVGYGIVQAVAPRFTSRGEAPPRAKQLSHWTVLLLLPLVGLLVSLFFGAPAAPTLTVGLALFGFVFAANSAIHSFLIISYAEGDRVAMNVGFYYMANAAGRLVGTVLSGAVFQMAGQGLRGLLACLAGAVLLVLLSRLLCIPLRAAERRG